MKRTARAIAQGGLAAALFALAACTGTRTSTGAVLNAGESARVHLLGSPTHVDILNTGAQSIDYTLESGGVQQSSGSIGPGGRVVERRRHGDVTVTITNPGPGPAQAMVETRSANGMEFERPVRGT